MTAIIYVLLCLLWGSTWLAIKIGLQDAPPLSTAALRFISAMLVLSSIGFIRGYRYPRDGRSLVKLAYPGIYMYGISYAFIYFAEQHINSALTAVLFGSFPFWVALLSWVRYRRERLSWKAWIGMFVGFSGVVLISYESLQTSEHLFLGTVLAVGGAFTAAYGIVIHKRYFSEFNIVVAANVQMVFGGILLVVGALLFEDLSDFNVTSKAIGSVLYLATFGTVVTFLGYYWLLRKTGAVTVSLIAFITPLVAILIGVGLGGESLSFLIVIGTILILSGVAAVIRT
jgi:drug/metabolite transporter (DMT)-like permease